MRLTRPISWIKAAKKDLENFPGGVQDEALTALTIVAEGGKPDNAKPLTGLGSGVLEIVLKDRSGTYRVVYALQIDADIWVIHAFQKKSTQGIKTPLHEINLIKERIKRLNEALK